MVESSQTNTFFGNFFWSEFFHQNMTPKYSSEKNLSIFFKTQQIHTYPHSFERYRVKCRWQNRKNQSPGISQFFSAKFMSQKLYLGRVERVGKV